MSWPDDNANAANTPAFIFYLYRALSKSRFVLLLSVFAMVDSEEAPPEVHHYNGIHEVPWDIQK